MSRSELSSVEDEADRAYIRRALDLAARGWGRVSPNPLVGAVLVRDGEVVGEGWHAEFGQPHAEANALQQAGTRARGATAYVSLEPCAHQGKTPPCADLLIEAGVTRVVFACADPNPRARGGAARLREAGVIVQSGICEQRARDLNASFFHSVENAGPSRPWIELKLALSLDARIADRSGGAAWITGEAARAEVHRLRAGHDAIAVGIGTVLADDPLLTPRGDLEPRIPPTRVVFDHQLRIPLSSRLVATARSIPTWVVCGPGAPSDARAKLDHEGVTIITATDLPSALETLRADGIISIFCEGGAMIASALLAAGAVDRLTLFYAPLLLGPGGLDPFAGIKSPLLSDAASLRLLRAESFGADTLLSFAF